MHYPHGKVPDKAWFAGQGAGTLTAHERRTHRGKEHIMAKALVAYFSASGVTRGLAERLAQATGADLFEIEAQPHYTAADLNWNDRSSRSSQEHADASIRPAIAGRVADMSQYDVVFVGFPVWWYREPNIIDTFMESYDFSGKTVVPFATSGMSPIGKSGANMARLAPGAKVEKGQRFAASTSADKLASWARKWL